MSSIYAAFMSGAVAYAIISSLVLAGQQSRCEDAYAVNECARVWLPLGMATESFVVIPMEANDK
jgi:thymidylate synthase ThyX